PWRVSKEVTRVCQIFGTGHALFRRAATGEQGRQADEDSAEMAVDMVRLRGALQGALVAGNVVAPLRAGHRHDPRGRVVRLEPEQVAQGRLRVPTSRVAAGRVRVP